MTRMISINYLHTTVYFHHLLNNNEITGAKEKSEDWFLIIKLSIFFLIKIIMTKIADKFKWLLLNY